MSRIFFIIIFLLIGPVANAQLLNIEDVNPLDKVDMFNPRFVEQNSIRSIKISQMRKPNEGALEKLMGEDEFIFNSSGQVEFAAQVRILFGKRDTSETMFKFDASSRLISKTTSTSRHSNTLAFGYEGDELANTSLLAEGGDTPIRLNSESVVWRAVNDTLHLRTFLNDLGIPYKEERTQLNGLGYVVARSETMLMTRKKVHQTLRYNDMGRLEERTQSSKQYSHIGKYNYDELGNLLSVVTSNTHSDLTRIEVVYSSSFLVEGLLVQNLESNDITIYKFAYTFS